jgi:O-antigen/teichoic acid export membrane protein
MGIYMRSDALMLERLDSAVSSSIYAEAYRILDALNMFGFLVAGILLPMFTRLLSKGLPVQQIVQISTNIMVSIGLCIVAHSLFYRNEIMLLLDKHADPTLPTVYAAVILTFPAYCLMYIFSTLLTASGHIQLLVKIALLGCVLSIGLNLFFIPRYHALGAGYTAIVVQYAVAFLSVYFCTIKFKTSQVSAWGYKFVLLTILLLLVNYLFYTFKVPLLWSVLLNIPFFFIAVYVIKLWDMANLLRLIRQYSSPDSR